MSLGVDAILEFSADGVVIMDGSHTIITFNRALVALSGIQSLRASELEVKSLQEWDKSR